IDGGLKAEFGGELRLRGTSVVEQCSNAGHVGQHLCGTMTDNLSLKSPMTSNLAPVRHLRDDGTLDPGHTPALSLAEVVEAYRQMVRTRNLDERLTGLQRQGRIGFHVGSLGEEAAIIGAAIGLRTQDWLFPCYREFGAALTRGF